MVEKALEIITASPQHQELPRHHLHTPCSTAKSAGSIQNSLSFLVDRIQKSPNIIFSSFI